jgi:Replication initiation and membrane attachment protein (DnaB).
LGLFSFDEQYAFFDVTPVDNLFIQEYLPGASGDYVRVYLYGLMHTYHPQKDTSLSAFARELNLQDTDIENAFRYWERRGLVQKTAENPPAYRYLSAKQVLLSGKPMVDEKYEEFGAKLQSLFGATRKLHGGETRMAFEWVEELRLNEDVVLMLCQSLIETRGRQFTFQSAQKQAIALKEENIQTAEDAKAYLSRKKAIYDGAKKVLRRMNKRRLPTEDELDLYEKWHIEWGFSHDAILEACREMVKGDPSFAYLGGILSGVKSRAGEQLPNTKTRMETALDTDKKRGEPLKALYRILGMRAAPVNDGTVALYEQMRSVASEDVITLAAKECARTGGRLDEVLQLVTSWKNRGIETSEQATAYIAKFNAQNAFLQDMYTLWGRKGRPTASDRTLLTRWREEYGFSDEALCMVAPHAEHTEKPMAYMEAILKKLQEKGITNANEVLQSLTASKKQPPAKGKTVSHQEYTQREYHEDDLAELRALLKKENEHD